MDPPFRARLDAALRHHARLTDAATIRSPC
jgi:hypothetical protein